ncbi:ATP-binding cassette sub-family G member 4 [Drosophila hydei]|uniref:ATP-binding cassette sub-family G member 4 n=1 Tax=Drosophila hydei TaxID=7224 RepID=A0A6J1M1N5_DROHY|nr:ATP-binding cassette sub-family G member 4 [Drosophila hydei]XP_023170516.2 ATP-binding cassette sub-family G member 4 [Drosophila hydei]XP_023170517.2 ATP-binding cassette sub-family G member 4 [Drosophila hydei]
MSSWSLASAVSPTVTGAAAGDVIGLNNLKAASDRDIATATDSKQQKVARPTTPVPVKKLTSKRPPHLTLHIQPPPPPTTTTTTTRTREAHEAPLAEAENIALSCSSSIFGTPLGSAAALGGIATPESHNTSSSTSHSSNSTAGSIFPHEQYKTIKKIDIQFDNVQHSAKFGFFKRENKDILKGLSGYFRSGELNAIAGPSGAGKSTLLNILSGYTYTGYTGDFRINGKRRDLKAFKPNVAFITQDTSLQSFLSVKEAMHFAANLKIGTHMSPAAKKERVLSILVAIGMYESRNTHTGSLSGGQRKRLAIALELVNNPPVLVLDEPTSGLDSSTCNQLITLLKKLAVEGRNVIFTIHQPSALTFSMFDHLYAIAEGQCIYAGGAQNLVPFLSAVNLHCPESYNPVDYLMEIATHDYDADGEQQVDRLISLMDNGRNDDYRQSKTARVAQLATMRKVEQMMSSGILTPVTAPIMNSGTAYNRQSFNFKPMTTINELSSRVWESQTINEDVASSKSDANCCKPKKKKPKPTMSMPTLELDPAQLCKRENIYATPFYRQLNILLLRTFLLIWRDSSLTTMRFAIHLMIGLLIGFLYYGIGNDANNSMNNFRYVFYTIMFIMYCAFSGILVKFPLEFPIVSREHFNRWYSLRAYYVAITLADLPIQIICSSLFIVPTYLMTRQPLEPWRFGMFFLIVFMTALVAQSIGLTVGAALNLNLGAILGPFFICPFLAFSGFFLQEKDAPVYLRWFFDVSFLKYSLDGAMLALFGYDRQRLECNEMYCHLSRPKFILKNLDMEHANYQLAIFFMLGLLIMLRILAFYIMSFRLRLFR